MLWNKAGRRGTGVHEQQVQRLRGVGATRATTREVLEWPYTVGGGIPPPLAPRAKRIGRAQRKPGMGKGTNKGR